MFKKLTTITIAIVIMCCAIFMVFKMLILPLQKYNKAMSLIESKYYRQACILLNGLNYKDSESKISELIQCDPMLSIFRSEVGGYVYFGAYEQDNDTSNGKEDIEWKVLAKEGNNVFLISKYVLDCKPYNTTHKAVTWETCSLRTWLNGEFANIAFSSEEMNSINTSTVTADKNPSYSTTLGDDTNDKVFLLSIKEANQYFNSDESRKCVPTQYAVGQKVNLTIYGNSSWWLRSPGYGQFGAAYVLSRGVVFEYGCIVDSVDYGVRPALWVDVSKITK